MSVPVVGIVLVGLHVVVPPGATMIDLYQEETQENNFTIWIKRDYLILHCANEIT